MSEKQSVKQYIQGKLDILEFMIVEKQANVKKQQAERNELNNLLRQVKEELQAMQEPHSYVGDVVKQMGKDKVLEKCVVKLDKSIKIEDCQPNTRVALRVISYVLHKILPTKVNPSISSMKVKKVPDSTYDMIGGLDQQVKEIIELPIKHPQIIESVLLYEPPGTGKTSLARAITHHTFIRVSGSELVYKYIGEGVRRIRELFVMARYHSLYLILIDDVDSIEGARQEGERGGNSEVEELCQNYQIKLMVLNLYKLLKLQWLLIKLIYQIQLYLDLEELIEKLNFLIQYLMLDQIFLKYILKNESYERNSFKKIAKVMPGERRIHLISLHFEKSIAKVMKKVWLSIK